MRLPTKSGSPPPHHGPGRLCRFEGLRDDFTGGRQANCLLPTLVRLKFRFDDSLDFVAQALALAFLLLLGGAKARFFGTQFGDEVGTRGAVLAQGVSFSGLAVQGGLDFTALLGQVDADFA